MDTYADKEGFRPVRGQPRGAPHAAPYIEFGGYPRNPEMEMLDIGC